MKKRILLIAIVVLFVLGIVAFKYIPFGTVIYSKKTTAPLTIPKFSIFNDESALYRVKFKSFRSKRIIEKELKETLKKYKQCGTNYVDEKNNISITKFNVERGFILNSYTINYEKGELCR